MLLDRIEIDSHGPLNRVELGPLSHHLNVVLGTSGSGKTAISRFIRDSLIDREYPRGMLSGSAGRVVWVHQNGWIHCRREQDGSSGGRRSVEFESRGETTGMWNGYTDGWFSAAPQNPDRGGHATATATARHLHSSLASRTLGNIRIPESIVDGVMVDTTISSASRVVAACIAAGLDQADLAALPLENETAHFSQYGLGHDAVGAGDERQRRAMREELADVEAELSKLHSAEGRYRHEMACETQSRPHFVWNANEIDATHRQRAECIRRRDGLLERRASLIARRDQEAQNRHRYSAAASHGASEFNSAGPAFDSGRTNWVAREARLRSLHHRADSLRSRAAALQRWIAELDSHNGERTSYNCDASVAMESSLGAFVLPSSWYSASAEHLHNRIRQADQEIVTLRRVLADVRSLHEALSMADRATATAPESYDWLDDGWLRGRRYDYFVRAMDHYRSDCPWSDFYASAYQPLRPLDDLAMRIESTTRQLDWLLSRFDHPAATLAGRSSDPNSWMLEDEHDGLIEQSLRRVREQLHRRDYLRTAHINSITADLNQTLDRLLVHRRRVVTTLAGQRRASQCDFTIPFNHHLDWFSERRSAIEELAGVEQELQVVLDQTAVLRHSQRHLPILDTTYPIGMGYSTGSAFDLDSARRSDAAVQAELRSIDAEIAACHRHLSELDGQLRDLQTRRSPAPVYQTHGSTHEITRLQSRRDELTAELSRCRPVARAESSLAELASRWLIRLSNGRHRMVRWSTSPTATDRYTSLAADAQSAPASDDASGRSVHVAIDRVDERNVSATTRAVAALAVRLAAGELLGRMGHSIPLVVETHNELFADPPYSQRHRSSIDSSAYQQWTSEGISGDAIASALADYSAAGRQLLILTENNALTNVLKRSGARHFTLHTQRVVHPHRPLWRGGQRHDRYAGPHTLNVDGLPSGRANSEDNIDWENAGCVNREFDHAWRQSAGLRQETHDGATATDLPTAGAAYRDGYYYANQTSTVPMADTTASRVNSGTDVAESLAARHQVSTMTNVDGSPFFLTVDSPIDAAPSIDAVAAQRLRRIGISHITHLMNQDSNRLADTLGLAGVDARTVRHWQAECRLMCRVPQLRGFDARVLVGCGITNPDQLAAIHPTDLLDRVKTFLATERGQRILLSGTSYELSRITSWIASASDSVHTNHRSRTVDGRRVRTRVFQEGARAPRRNSDAAARTTSAQSNDAYLTDDDFDQERYEVQVERRADRIVDDLDQLARDFDLAGDAHQQSPPHKERDGIDSNPGSTAASSSSYRMSSEAAAQSRRAQKNSQRQAERTQSTRGQQRSSERRSQPASQTSRNKHTESPSETTLRFYLQRADDVVDAPSIGPRMAERLNKIGIVSVDDLLHADAAEVAEKLNVRRIETATVIQWQQQTTLVCRVPMMRGHDAQFLVAVGVTTTEDLAKCDASELLELIDAIADSTEGKRIARGGELPDLAEVTQWIQYAAQHRSLRAA